MDVDCGGSGWLDHCVADLELLGGFLAVAGPVPHAESMSGEDGRVRAGGHVG
jgi:hypothetical protein